MGMRPKVAVDVAVLGTCVAMLVGASALLSPVLKLHSRIDLLLFRVERLEVMLERHFQDHS